MFLNGEEMVNSLFEQYENLKWEFTYGHEDDPDRYNAIQVGLVAFFYIDQGWKKSKRQAVTEALALYHQYYGEHLKFGYFDNPNHSESYSSRTLIERKQQILDKEDDAVELSWGDSPSLSYVSNYKFEFFSLAGWYENVHKSVSYVCFYLPFEELKKQPKGEIEKLLVKFCDLLKPMHGFAGLGVQQCYESHEYQYIEYTISHEFSGLDISGGNNDKLLRGGFKSVNWITILGDELVSKLGGPAVLRKQNDDDRIVFIPYQGGVMFRAGELPALGYVQTDPWPELYVKVNRLLNPVRAHKIDSLGYGSIAGEIRFNERTTQEWLTRFDRTEDTQDRNASSPGSEEKRHITVISGNMCRFSGLWVSVVNGETVYQELQQGFLAPQYKNEKTSENKDVVWTLLRRDDNGAVYE